MFVSYYYPPFKQEVQSSTIDDSKNNNNRMNDFQYEKEAHHVHAKHGATTLQLQQQQQQTDVGVVESKESLIYPNGLDFKVISTIPHDTSSFT